MTIVGGGRYSVSVLCNDSNERISGFLIDPKFNEHDGEVVFSAHTVSPDTVPLFLTVNKQTALEVVLSFMLKNKLPMGFTWGGQNLHKLG